MRYIPKPGSSRQGEDPAHVTQAHPQVRAALLATAVERVETRPAHDLYRESEARPTSRHLCSMGKAPWPVLVPCNPKRSTPPPRCDRSQVLLGLW